MRAATRAAAAAGFLAVLVAGALLLPTGPDSPAGHGSTPTGPAPTPQPEVVPWCR